MVSDADLIAASFSDPEQFGAIFERHFEPIHRYAARRLGGALADDLTARVFTIAFVRRRSNAMVNTRAVRSSARAPPSRRAAYRWIGSKWRSKIAPNCSGSENEAAIRSASLTIHYCPMPSNFFPASQP